MSSVQMANSPAIEGRRPAVRASHPLAESEISPSESETHHEDIARLAYFYWQDRGCPDGSPEEDWFRAEKALQERTVEAVA